MGKHGGIREGAGRPKKSDEAEMIAKLSELDEVAFSKLKDGVNDGSFHHLKLFYEYRYGKPKQLIGVVTDKESVEQVFKINGVEITL